MIELQFPFSLSTPLFMARDSQFSQHHIFHHHCRVCGNENALIRQYDLYMCRRCFRENALKVGFVKNH